MNGLRVMFGKELLDALRDRRAVMVAMLPAIFGPFLLMFLLSTAAETRSAARDETVTLGVTGAAHAPDLIDHLQRNGVAVETFDGDPRAAIHAREIPAVLAIPADFADAFAEFRPARVELFADHSRDSSDDVGDRVRDLIRDYGREIGALRLMVRGIDPGITTPIDIEDRDYSTRTSRAAPIFGTLQLILLMAAFFGGAGVAIDATAGERERNSWVSLLVHPMRAVDIIGGKWLTVATFAFAACLAAVIGTAIASRVFSLEGLGVDPRLTPAMMVGIVALQIPLVLLATSLQMLVTLFAGSFKEAQSYLGLLTLVPMLPVMISMFQDIRTETWMYLVPIGGQQQLMTAVMRGEAMSVSGFVLAAVVTSALAVAIFVVLTRLLRTERVVFGS